MKDQDRSAFSTLKIRKVASDQLVVQFPEGIDRELKAAGIDEDAIPPEYVIAVLARHQALQPGAAAGCGDRCNKDCFW